MKKRRRWPIFVYGCADAEEIVARSRHRAMADNPEIFERAERDS